MASPDLLGLLPLLWGEDRVKLPPDAADDRIHLRLDPAPDGTQLATFAVHDRVDSDLLLRCEVDLAGKAVSELAIAGWAAVPRPSWAAEETRPRTAVPTPGENQPIHRDSGEAAGKGHEQQDEKSEESSPWRSP